MTRWQWFAVIAVGVVIAAVLSVYQSLDDARERPAVQREWSRARLADYAQVIGSYRAAHDGQWPTDHAAIRAWSQADGDLPRITRSSLLVRGAGRYVYRPPAADDPTSTVIMASAQAHAGAAAGTPWGAAGEISPTAVPPVHIALDQDLQVVELSIAEHAKRAVWLVATIAQEGP